MLSSSVAFAALSSVSSLEILNPYLVSPLDCRYADGVSKSSDHMWWSVSKILVSCIAAILQEEGLLDVDKQVVVIPQSRIRP